MPFYLKDRNGVSDSRSVGSALIVPCRFCPAASLAVREGTPYLQPLQHILRTPSYEAYIRAIESRLERRGIRTGVFDSKWPHQFVLCMWTSGRRRKLARQLAGYDATIVLGCDAAVETVRSCTEPGDCAVIPAMDVEGIMNPIPSVRFPLEVRLEVSSVIEVSVHGGPKGPS